MKNVIVLLSSGLDSTVNLFAALAEGYTVKKVLTFDYGQKAASKEIEKSKIICKELKLSLEVIELPWLKSITQTSLVNESIEIPKGSQIDLNDTSSNQLSAKQVWVPNRNGVFLNIAAAFADALDVEFVVPGFNIEEAQTFPDNSQDYMNSLDTCFKFSTANKVRLKCFTSHLDKSQIIDLGMKLEAPFHHMWPCYYSGSEHCEECESCQRFYRAGHRVGLDSYLERRLTNEI